MEDAPAADRLRAFAQNPELAKQELLSVKDIYNNESPNAAPGRLGNISSWADEVRKAANISNNDGIYGNNPNIAPDVQNANITALRAAAQPKTAISASTQTAPTQQGYQSNYKGPNIDQWKNSLNSAIDLKRAAGLTSLKNQRDVALQGLNSSETQAKNSAYNQKNQVAGSSALAAKKLSELLAAQGISGGDNLSANARLQSAAQGSLSQIGQNESAILQDIMEKRGLTNSQASSQEMSLIQESESDRINRLLDLDKYGDQSAMNLDQINYGRYSDELNRSFQQQQAGIQNKLAEAGLTGSYGGQDTLSKIQMAAQNAAQQWQQQQAEKQFDYQAGRDQVGDNRWQNQFNYQQGRDQIGDQQWNMNFGLNERQTNSSIANANADNELQRQRLAAEQSQVSAKQQSQASEKMNSELQGLSSAIRGGTLSAEQAYQQIEEDIKLGFYTQDDAAQLRSAVRTLTGKNPVTSTQANPFIMPYQSLLYKK